MILKKLQELDYYYNPGESEQQFEKFYLSISLGTSLGFLARENEFFMKSSYLEYMIFIFNESNDFLSFYICLVLLTNFLEDFVGFKNEQNINKLRQILSTYEKALQGYQIPHIQDR